MSGPSNPRAPAPSSHEEAADADEPTEHVETAAGAVDALDVAVVGSGVGGLCAALTLANEGYAVGVYEAAAQLGGYLNPFARRGYRFDPAVHYVGEGAPGQLFDRVLRALGVRDEVPLRALEGAVDVARFGDESYPVPGDACAYLERLRAWFPSERDGLERLFALLDELRSATDATLAPRAWGHALPPPRALARLLRYHRRSFAEVLHDHLRTPRARAVLAGQHGNYALPPSRAAAEVGLGTLDHYLRGAYALVGGGGALRDALVARLRARGALLRTRAPVRALTHDGRAVTGLRCADGRVVRARAVLSNVDAARTYRALLGLDALGPLARRRVPPLAPSHSALSLFVGARIDPRAWPFREANLWHHAHDDLEALYATMPSLRGEGALDAPLRAYFAAVPAHKERGATRVAGEQPCVVQLSALCDGAGFEGAGLRRSESYVAAKRRFAERALAALERELPGLGARVEVCEVATPATHARYVRAEAGALYGAEHTSEQRAARVGVVGLLPGLYHCGASVHGAGVVACALSGHSAGLEALTRLRGA